jgi:alginate production protein
MRTTLHATFVLFGIAATVAAEPQLVGQRIKVSGTYREQFLAAQRVQFRDTDKDPREAKVTGRIDRVDSNGLAIGPVAVEWQPATRFQGLNRGDLKAGRVVSVTGLIVEPRRLSAATIEPAGRLENLQFMEISGTVTAASPPSHGSRDVTILGVPIRVRDGLFNEANDLTRNPDDRRPTNQATVSVFGRPLTLGGEIGTNSRFRRNRELDQDDPTARLDQALQLELRYPINDGVLVFVKGNVGYDSQVYPTPAPGETEWSVERNEHWVYFGNVGGTGLSLQLGRQRFFEEREWWWDTELDAVRLRFDRPAFHAEAALAKEIAPKRLNSGRIAREEQGVRRLFAHTAYSWSKNQRIDGFWLHHRDGSETPAPGAFVPKDDADETDARLDWFGGRLSGRRDTGSAGELSYRVDLAKVTGNESRLVLSDAALQGLRRVVARVKRPVDGWASGAGLSWASALPGEPTLTAEYARGSVGFRQTSLQDNNGKFHGVDRFRYYGELSRPSLENVRVLTLAAGCRLFGSSSAELLHHRYRQTAIAAGSFGSVDAPVLGASDDLGSEWNLVVGLEQWQHVEIEVVGARFRSGAAYGPLEGRTSHAVIAKIDLNF